MTERNEPAAKKIRSMFETSVDGSRTKVVDRNRISFANSTVGPQDKFKTTAQMMLGNTPHKVRPRQFLNDIVSSKQVLRQGSQDANTQENHSAEFLSKQRALERYK